MSGVLLWGLVSSALAADVVGVVRERGTADPVEAATVQLVAGGAALATTSSDARGAYRLTVPGELPQDAVLLVIHPEYLPLELSASAARSEASVYLRPAPPAPELVVESRRPSDHAVRHVLDRERVEETPGTFDDPVRLLQSLPGVAVTPEYSPTAGVLAVRGAAPAESRVFLDGVEIPYLYHFQNYASVVHSRLLDEVALYPSAFGSEWGDAVGGVAQVTTRRADPARVHGGVNVNAITTGAFVTAPLSDGAALSVSGRRSIADLLDDSNDQYTVWPVFWDYLGRLDLGSADRRVSVMGIGAGDSYGRYPGDTATFDPLERATAPDFRYDRAFHGLITTGEVSSEDARHEAVLGLVRDRWTGSLSTDSQTWQTWTTSLRMRSNLRQSDALTWAFGGDGRHRSLSREAATSRAWTELGVEAPLLAQGLDVDETLQRVQGGVWFEPQLSTDRARLQPGLRVQGDSLSGGWAPEPRLTTAWEWAPDRRLRGAVGRYTQAPSGDALSPTTGRPELGLSVSEQVALGVDLAVAGRFEVVADVYGRQIRNTVEVDPGDAEGLGAVRVREARAGGVELQLRTRQRERLFFAASLVLSRSERRDSPDLAWAPGDYDQPYAINAVVSWDFAPGWNGGLRYRRASGLPFTPLAGTYDGNTDTWQPVPLEENSARLPDYQKLDLHLERAIAFEQWTLTGYLEAWWVPPESNAMYVVYAYDYTERSTVAGPPFVPLLGVRAEL